MSWLPSLKIVGSTVCDVDGTFEGRTLHIRWFDLVVEFTVARWEAD